MTLNREELAWAAGLFEGEGCFHFAKPKDGSRNTRCCITMTDLVPLQKFHAAIQGLGNINGPYQLKHKSPKWSAYWTWSAGSFEQSQAVVAMLWPWLCERRRAAAKDMFTRYHAHACGYRTYMKLAPRHTTAQSLEIRRLHQSGISQKQIAAMFNRSQAGISMILSGKRKAV